MLFKFLRVHFDGGSSLADCVSTSAWSLEGANFLDENCEPIWQIVAEGGLKHSSGMSSVFAECVAMIEATKAVMSYAMHGNIVFDAVGHVMHMDDYRWPDELMI